MHIVLRQINFEIYFNGCTDVISVHNVITLYTSNCIHDGMVNLDGVAKRLQLYTHTLIHHIYLHFRNIYSLNAKNMHLKWNTSSYFRFLCDFDDLAETLLCCRSENARFTSYFRQTKFTEINTVTGIQIFN